MAHRQHSIRGKAKPAGGASFSVAILLLPEFTLQAFSSFIEVLRLAADKLDTSRQIHCRWSVLSVNAQPVRASCGTYVIPSGSLSDGNDFDYIVVVGGLIDGHRKVAPAIFKYLQSANRDGRNIVGLCTGSFILATAGLLAQHKASVHWAHEAQFRRQFPHLTLSRGLLFSVSARRMTCSGGTACADLAGYLVQRHLGANAAHKAMTALGLSSLRSGKDLQVQQPAKWLRSIRDPVVLRAVLVMVRNIGRKVTLRNACADLSLSNSTLNRAFRKAIGCSPATFNRALRVAYAHWELTHSAKTITEIASELGFCDTSHFIQVFRRFYGTTPVAARHAASDEPQSKRTPRIRVEASRVVKQVLRGQLLFFEDDYEWLEQQLLS